MSLQCYGLVKCTVQPVAELRVPHQAEYSPRTVQRPRTRCKFNNHRKKDEITITVTAKN
jgi:hypothetical protein